MEEISSQFKTLFFAGMETTASLTSMAIVMLAFHPKY
jgi:cytochrome P450